MTPLSPSPPTLTDIARKALNGNEDAIAVVVEQLGRRLAGFLLKKGINHHDANDFVQEVFKKFIEGKYDPENDRATTIESWAFRVIINLCINKYRDKSILTTACDIHDHNIRSNCHDPFEESLGTELSERVTSFIRQLDSEEQTIIDLKARGSSMKEIAAIISKPHNASRAKLSRIRAIIKEHFILDKA